MDTLVDSAACHLRLREVGRVAQVCRGLYAATLRHIELPARACYSLRYWRATARHTRTAWQTVMMWRRNASRLADEHYAESMMQELEEMIKEDEQSCSEELTDEEADFLEHHMMKQTWEQLAVKYIDALH